MSEIAEPMGWMEFIVELVKALAWPICAVALGLVLKKPVLGLISAISKVKVGEVEMEITKSVKLLESEVKQLPLLGEMKQLPAPAQSPDAAAEALSLSRHLTQFAADIATVQIRWDALLAVSPGAAMIGAVQDVQREAAAAVDRLGKPSTGDLVKDVDVLVESDLFPASLRGIAVITNKVAESATNLGSSMPIEVAMDFLTTARSFVSFLMAIGR